MYLSGDKEAGLKEIAGEHWEKSPSTEVELQHILDRIHFHINTVVEKRPSLTRILSAYYRVAAVLLVPLLIGGIYLMSQNLKRDETSVEIMAPHGSRVQFTLPDGSMGFLNGGSRLQYPVNFSGKRKVSLTGEGYFTVAKDKKHPFTVHTKYADVRVLGTKFDVCAYESDQEVYTTLEEGSVQIFNKTEKTYAILNPGEQNVISTINGNMKNTSVNTKLYTSWKEEMLRFNNSPFDEVVKKMERWYGVKIMLDKSLKYSENYTFTVRTESLRELLQLLSITTPMNFKIDNDTVMIYPAKQKKMK
jgi:ferric-dicitrate binding protein FerR (iron transport regulator)